MKKATITYSYPTSKDFIARLRAGEKGKGRVIFTVKGWRDSSLSVSKADEVLAEVAEREGYQIIDNLNF